MIGIDNSQEMLNIAQRKKESSGKEILYLMQDMRELELYGCVGAVVSVCDSLNYLLEEEDKCLEWHAFYQDEQLWQIDMIHIVQGSKYAGYFERVAERILQIMSEAQKEQILKLKFETPDNLKIAGIEYYQAVLQEGITDFTEFMQWHKSRPQNAIVEWIP